MKKGFIKILVTLGVASFLIMPFIVNEKTAVASAQENKNLDAGAVWVINETVNLNSLTIGEGAVIKAPDGYSVTLTIDGVETGIKPGVYKGRIVLTKTEANVVEYKKGSLTHYYRQALYLDETGIVAVKSVLPAAGNYKLSKGILTGAKITSSGECFNGIYVSGGAYTINNPLVDFTGNGGNDFSGYGAAIMATGEKTTLVLDQAKVKTRGAVRTAIITAGGSNVIIKNSDIQANDGVLPKDYRPNTTLGHMKNVPWFLGLVGNCRATNVLGEKTTATYIKSSIAAEAWGVLSTDDCKDIRLTAINSKISITGKSGYGAYSIGNGLVSFYGSDVTVPDYSLIITGGNAILGASTPETLSQLNSDLKLGLSNNELKSIEKKPTIVKSGRFGVMWHGKGYVKIKDDTILDCKKTIFLIRGSGGAEMYVDGSKGAKLNTGNGVIVQVIDLDKPSARDADDGTGLRLTDTIYTEPYSKYSDIPMDNTHNLYVADDTDVSGSFSHIKLDGNFYNGTTGGKDLSRNLSLKFEDSKITGVISATFTKHAKSSYGSDDYLLIGEVTNTPCAAINNGVIISLAKSTWTVTGTSYLTKLSVAEDSAVIAPEGFSLAMTVDGVGKAIKSGAYEGKIVLTVIKL
jgi:hypothetical protein